MGTASSGTFIVEVKVSDNDGVVQAAENDAPQSKDDACEILGKVIPHTATPPHLSFTRFFVQPGLRHFVNPAKT